MTQVSSLGVGGGLNHLGEVEFPEVVTEIVGGRLIRVYMRHPTGHDLLCNPLLLGKARQRSGSTICREVPKTLAAPVS